MIHYARSGLARELAEQLQGKQVFNDAYNGLFLAAPRRTGKSTFLQLLLRLEEPPFVEIEPGHSVACWKAVS